MEDIRLVIGLIKQYKSKMINQSDQQKGSRGDQKVQIKIGSNYPLMKGNHYSSSKGLVCTVEPAG